MDNLAAHIQIVRQYGLPCVVAVNSFPTDYGRARSALLKELAVKAGAETVVVHEGFAQGGAGAVELADAVDRGVRASRTPSRSSRPTARRSVEQIEAIATKLYGAAGIDLQMQAQKDLERIEKLGLGTALVCMAKTHLSLSHDPMLRNRPTGFILPIREPGAERRRRLRRGAVRRHAAHAGSRQDARPSSRSTSTKRGGRWDCSNVRNRTGCSYRL